MDAAIRWITGYDIGASSKALWSHMMTGTCDGSYPYDADDFGRIARLLDVVPEWRSRLPEMREYGPQWRALVEAWDELHPLYRAWWKKVDAQVFAAPSQSRPEWDAFRERLDRAYDLHVVCGVCAVALKGSWRKRNGALFCWSCSESNP